MRNSVLIFLLVLLSGCAGLPSLQKVEHSFAHENPDATVIGVSGELTNRLYAQFHIHYTKVGDSIEHEDVWHYHHTAEAWIAGKRESVR